MTGGWRIAFRNLRRNRRRNVATATAIALGFAGLSILGGYITRVELFLRTNTVYLQHGGHVVVYKEDGLEKANAKPRQFSLSAEDQARVRAVLASDPRVEFSATYLRGMGLAGNGCRTVPFVGFGIEPGVLERIVRHPDVLYISADFVAPVRGEQLFAYRDVDGAVGLSTGLARLLGKTRIHDDFGGAASDIVVPDCTNLSLAQEQIASDANIQLAALGFDGSLSAIDGEVVNVFHTPTTDTEDRTLHTSLDTLRRLYATDAATYVAAYLRNWREAEAVAVDLDRRLQAERVAADVYPFSDDRVSPYYVGSMQFLNSMAAFIVLLVTSVVVLGVMNATTLTVFERTRELGTFRALGYTRRQVVGLLVREVTLLAVLGVAGGILLAQLVALGVRLAEIRITPPGVPGSLQVVLTPGVGIYASLTLLLLPLSVLVTWVVARRRARLRTSDLLTAATA